MSTRESCRDCGSERGELPILPRSIARLDDEDEELCELHRELRAELASDELDIDIVECECGYAGGVRCTWSDPIWQTTAYEYMPEHLRASHEAAGNSGSWPGNGAVVLRVEASCAERLSEEE